MALASCALDPQSSNAAAAQSSALGSPLCSMPMPEGWRALDTGPGVLASYIETFDRAHVERRSTLVLREPRGLAFEDAIAEAKAEEHGALGDKPDFKLVRDQPMRDAVMPAHLLVYRYRPAPGAWVVLRFHVVYSTGFRTLDAVGESQATPVDSLRLPHGEAGLHEFWMRPALAQVRCSR